MNELREQMLPVLVDVADGDLTYRAATDRILALVAEALLSDDVVEAVARYPVEDEGDDWANLCERYPSVAKASLNCAEGEVKAALAAAGITTTGEEVGE